MYISRLLQVVYGLFLIFLFLTIPSALYAESIIADHTSVPSFNDIPFTVIEDIQDNAHIYYARTSHGYQIIVGIDMLYNENSSYQSPYFYQRGDDLGYNGDTSWVPHTRTYLDSHPECNLAMFSWCGGVIGSTEEHINIYLSKMTELEGDYPNVTFVYMTGHLDAGGINDNLHLRNNQIRTYCLNNDKVLFDFADIESYDPDGNYYPDGSDACYWCYDWCAVHDCPTCDGCPHSHCFNCYQKGKAFWWMMAKIYGWGDNGTVAPSNCNASSGICNYVQVSWTDNADNETGYRIKRDGSILTTLPANSSSYEDTGANPGQEYDYTVEVYNDSDTAFCEAGSGIRPGPVAAPSGCDASIDISSYVQLSWNDNADNETGYRIQRDGIVLADLTSNSTGYNDSDAIPGQEYNYTIEVLNQCDTAFCDAGIGIRPVSIPSPSNCDASDDISDYVQISWTDNADNETGYRIMRDGSVLTTLPANSSNYNDTGANPGQQYNYSVEVYNASDTAFCDAGVGMRPGSIAAPTNCAASSIYCECIRISWTDNSDNEDGYRLFRDGSFHVNLPANFEAYNDYSAIPGQEHAYEVLVYNSFDTSFCSAGTGIRLAGVNAPTNADASENSCDFVRITWTDNSENENGYRLLRNGTNLIDLDPNTELYDDFNTTPGQTYTYTVEAYNGCNSMQADAGEGTRLNQVNLMTNCNASDDLCEHIQIAWTDNSNSEDGYRIRRNGTIIAELDADIESYNDTEALPGQEYNYAVEVFNVCDTIQGSAGTGIRLDAPAAPSLISPVNEADDLSIPVSFVWDSTGSRFLCQVDENEAFVEPLITSVDYLNSPQVQISEGMERGKKYYWRARAHNDCGWSDWSEVYQFSTEYLGMTGIIFSQTDLDTIVHEIVELYKYGEFDPFKTTETYCVPTGQKDAGDSLTMYHFDSLLQDVYSIKFMDYWIYDSISLEDNYKCDSLNIEWTGLGWTDVEEIDVDFVPESYSLFQNYPNPFNPRTRIEFEIPKESYVIVDVLNIKGELVKSLVHQNLSAGHKAVTWNGKDNSGQPASSGIYLYRLVTDDFVLTRKMVLLK